ncbi:MAG: PGPGW domain-containing protein [Candidatus Acidiferrales bacterium]
MLSRTIESAKRILKIVLGFALLGLGVALIFTPGPGWLTILLALGLLAAEFGWARRLLDRMKEEGARLRALVTRRIPRDADA